MSAEGVPRIFQHEPIKVGLNPTRNIQLYRSTVEIGITLKSGGGGGIRTHEVR